MGIKVIKQPDLDIDSPDKRFWMSVGTQVAKDIRKRTETDGKDAQGNKFNPYSPKYAKYRRKKGRTTQPNLSFTGKMLGALARGITATKRSAKITLSGREGAKAYYLEQPEQGERIFMEISRKAADKIIKDVSQWMARKNKLK